MDGGERGGPASAPAWDTSQGSCNTHQRIRNISRPWSENRGRIDKCLPDIPIVM